MRYFRNQKLGRKAENVGREVDARLWDLGEDLSATIEIIQNSEKEIVKVFFVHMNMS